MILDLSDHGFHRQALIGMQIDLALCFIRSPWLVVPQRRESQLRNGTGGHLAPAAVRGPVCRCSIESVIIITGNRNTAEPITHMAAAPAR